MRMAKVTKMTIRGMFTSDKTRKRNRRRLVGNGRFGMILLFALWINPVSAQNDQDRIWYSEPQDLNEVIRITKVMVDDIRYFRNHQDWQNYHQKRVELAKFVTRSVDNRIVNCNDARELPVAQNFSACKQVPKARQYYGDDNLLMVNWAWANQAGNCQENANIVYYILKQANVPGNIRIITAAKWHAFTVWGLNDSADLADPKTWGFEALALDSWWGDVLSSEQVEQDYYFHDNGATPLEDETTRFDMYAGVWRTPPSYSNNQKSAKELFGVGGGTKLQPIERQGVWKLRGEPRLINVSIEKLSVNPTGVELRRSKNGLTELKVFRYHDSNTDEFKVYNKCGWSDWPLYIEDGVPIAANLKVETDIIFTRKGRATYAHATLCSTTGESPITANTGINNCSGEYQGIPRATTEPGKMRSQAQVSITHSRTRDYFKYPIQFVLTCQFYYEYKFVWFYEWIPRR